MFGNICVNFSIITENVSDAFISGSSVVADHEIFIRKVIEKKNDREVFPTFT
jgi:hypothetical protein